MDDLFIGTLEGRYRLRGFAADGRKRLDRLLGIVAEEALDLALQRLEIGAEEEICIKSIFAPVRLQLARSDGSLVAEWSLALAEAIRCALSRPDDDAEIIRYRSKLRAFCDFALRVAAGDTSRAWAWKQLGLSNVSEAAGEGEAVEELVRNLLARPESILPLLRLLCERRLLIRLAKRLNTEHWSRLAFAASVISQADWVWREITVPPSALSQDAVKVLEPLLARSSLARELMLLPTDNGAAAGVEEDCRAVLAVLDVSPSLLRTQSDAARRTLSAARSLIRNAADERPAPVDLSVLATNAEKESGVLDIHSGANEGRELKLAQIEPALNEAAFSIEPERAFTGHGGLLYLLNVLNALELPDAMLADGRVEGRALAWLLHRLALTLISTSARDPAVLAFAGLKPGSETPSTEAEPSSEIEQEALEGFAARVVDELTERLALPELNAGALLRFVCERRAEIVADPGWIEARFSPDDVSLEVRRAGLDLNPNYLPWLGVVVRFSYDGRR